MLRTINAERIETTVHDILPTMLTTALTVVAILGLGFAGAGPVALIAALAVLVVGAIGLGRVMAGLLVQTECARDLTAAAPASTAEAAAVAGMRLSEPLRDASE